MLWLLKHTLDSGAGLKGQLQKEVNPANSMLFNPLCSQFQEAGRSRPWAQLVALCLRSVGFCWSSTCSVAQMVWRARDSTWALGIQFLQLFQAGRERGHRLAGEQWNQLWSPLSGLGWEKSCLDCVLLASREICEIQAIFTILLVCVCIIYVCVYVCMCAN